MARRKDDRPYYIQVAEKRALEAMAKNFLKILKTKNSVDILEEEIIKNIFNEIDKEIIEVIASEVSITDEGKYYRRNIFGSKVCNSPAEEIIKERREAEKNFDELHLYGRVEDFWKRTGYSLKPDRDSSGNRRYVIYDSKKIFVVKRG